MVFGHDYGKDSLALIWHDLFQARLSLDGQLRSLLTVRLGSVAY